MYVFLSLGHQGEHSGGALTLSQELNVFPPYCSTCHSFYLGTLL